MRRKKINKFSSTGTGSGSSGEEQARNGTSSEPDPSSSDFSADTVIYVGPADSGTDGEHPPVYIPSLNSGDNRAVMSKVLKGTNIEQQKSKKTPTKQKFSSPKASPSKKINNPSNEKHKPGPSTSDEQWIDGPKISKKKVEHHFLQSSILKKETWIDGPLKPEIGYGYMDSHKKSMIKKWVAQSSLSLKKPKKELTTFKEDPLIQILPKKEEIVVRPLEKSVKKFEESVIRTGLKGPKVPDLIQECSSPDKEEEEIVIPPPLPLIEPLSSRESQISIESLQSRNQEDDQEEFLEIIEVEEPLEPVSMQDCCLQCNEEDILMSMGENPLPEVDQREKNHHPLRILSEENLTVVSTFTDSLSIYQDLERLMPNFNKCNLNLMEPKVQLQKLSRSESLSITDLLYGTQTNDVQSIYSEPAYYIPEKLCHNCKVPLEENQWNTPEPKESNNSPFKRFQHDYLLLGNYFFDNDKFGREVSRASLRHPDGASNPNLQEEQEQKYQKIDDLLLPNPDKIQIDESESKKQQQENYDSGNETNSRTSKNSPGTSGLSRRAESGYSSVLRDSESSSLESDSVKLKNRRFKSKHKNDRSFCSWLLNPFTCKYIEEPPETHF